MIEPVTAKYHLNQYYMQPTLIKYQCPAYAYPDEKNLLTNKLFRNQDPVAIINIGYLTKNHDTITILNSQNTTIATLKKQLKYSSCQNGNCTTADGNNGTYYQNSCNIYCK